MKSLRIVKRRVPFMSWTFLRWEREKNGDSMRRTAWPVEFVIVAEVVLVSTVRDCGCWDMSFGNRQIGLLWLGEGESGISEASI